ncbi:MAG: nucleotide sugar dehydrogenase [Nitrososphaerales archaeon]
MEGKAIEGTFKPDRIIIGEIDKSSGDFLEGFYKEFYSKDVPPIIRTSLVNAELIKYANNAFLAMKVSFINMIANLCQKLPNSDVEVIAKGIGLDKRIGELFLRSGAGFGGSCFPKDLKALLNFGIEKEVNLPLIEATLKINDDQPYKLIELAKELIGDLKGKRISILGLSFKPNTDDMRNAISIKIVNRLLEEGSKIIVYDPKAMKNAKRIFGNRVEYADNLEDCLKGSDCALIVTEWDEFKKLKPQDFINLMKIPAIVDGRRIYDAKDFSSKLKFSAIGFSNM